MPETKEIEVSGLVGVSFPGSYGSSSVVLRMRVTDGPAAARNRLVNVTLDVRNVTVLMSLLARHSKFRSLYRVVADVLDEHDRVMGDPGSSPAERVAAAVHFDEKLWQAVRAVV